MWSLIILVISHRINRNHRIACPVVVFYAFAGLHGIVAWGKPCDWLRGVGAMVLRSHRASRHDEVYDKFCGFKFLGVHFLLIRFQ